MSWVVLILGFAAAIRLLKGGDLVFQRGCSGGWWIVGVGGGRRRARRKRGRGRVRRWVNMMWKNAGEYSRRVSKSCLVVTDGRLATQQIEKQSTKRERKRKIDNHTPKTATIKPTLNTSTPTHLFAAVETRSPAASTRTRRPLPGCRHRRPCAQAHRSSPPPRPDGPLSAKTRLLSAWSAQARWRGRVSTPLRTLCEVCDAPAPHGPPPHGPADSIRFGSLSVWP